VIGKLTFNSRAWNYQITLGYEAQSGTKQRHLTSNNNEKRYFKQPKTQVKWVAVCKKSKVLINISK